MLQALGKLRPDGFALHGEARPAGLTGVEDEAFRGEQERLIGDLSQRRIQGCGEQLDRQGALNRPWSHRDHPYEWAWVKRSSRIRAVAPAPACKPAPRPRRG